MIASALSAASLLIPSIPAQAADGCGSGWYRESDGFLTKDHVWYGEGSHNAVMYHGGRVRYCTDDDPFNDDQNRRVIIGGPYDYDDLTSDVTKNGVYTHFCIRQSIKAYITGVKSSESWSISGGVSKDSPEVSASYSATYDNLTVKVAKNQTCNTAHRTVVSTGGVVLTGTSDDSAEVQWVELTTRISMDYTVNGTRYTRTYSMVERDYS